MSVGCKIQLFCFCKLYLSLFYKADIGYRVLDHEVFKCGCVKDKESLYFLI